MAKPKFNIADLVSKLGGGAPGAGAPGPGIGNPGPAPDTGDAATALGATGAPPTSGAMPMVPPPPPQNLPLGLGGGELGGPTPPARRGAGAPAKPTKRGGGGKRKGGM